MKKIFSILSLILLFFVGLIGCQVIDKNIDIPDVIPPIIDTEETPEVEDGIKEETPEVEDDIKNETPEIDFEENPTNEDNVPEENIVIDKDGIFTSKDDVALYISVYGRLPSNYRTKSEVSGHISSYWTPENLISVGGDIFFNREKLLPIKSGRTYYEADINYRGQLSRGKERIVFSDDGLIFFTNDHYENFIEYDAEVGVWK